MFGKKGCKRFKALRTALAVAVFAAIFTAGGTGYGEELENGDLFIPAEEVSETASFYPVEVEGTKMEIFAVKAPDGTIRTAFNTCQVCYGSGRGYYKQEGSVLVCQNCGNRFKTSDIEVARGGCNPVPITSKYKSVDESGVTIPKDFLLRAKVIFAKWKRQ
ncbi:MAG: DUF2318 domain-containing protein [Synergistaceae bacterium]|jgi:uncharacterized membrane protein|nr:DUF2318 domain-containing protein [Synergistaceae bacterium]